ncbi:MAG: restriction endonuclease subunit S [Patescibacteria group bacterium]|nr:restriction endonuclease subunit S [Patescibacteria group bacterium]
MKTSWQKTTLGNISTLITKGTTPTTFGDNFVSKGINFLKIESISDDGRLIRDKVSYISESTNAKLRRSVMRTDDILFSIAGAIGRVMLVKSGYLPANANQALAIIRVDQDRIIPKFVFYYLFNKRIRAFACSQVAQSVQANINLSQLSNFIIPLPPLQTQRAIARVLSSFDDKIELLREENKILENIAQTIFKEWFVKDENDLPEGWRMERLEKIADITIGRTPPRNEEGWFSKDPRDNSWISIRDMGTSGIYISNSAEYLTQEAVERFNVPVIPEDAVVLSFKLTIGRLAITTHKMYSNEAIACLKLKDKGFVSTEYLYLFLRNFDFNKLGSTSSIATAFNSTSIKMIEIIIPKENLMTNFNKKIEPIFKKIKNNQIQIKTLSKLRDTLLPKLMSGEVEV